MPRILAGDKACVAGISTGQNGRLKSFNRAIHGLTLGLVTGAFNACDGLATAKAGDDLVKGQHIANLDINLTQVAIHRDQALAVIDDDGIPIEIVITGSGDHAR